MNDVNNAEHDNFDNVAPNAEHINNQDCTIKNKPSELFGCFDPGTNDEDELVIKRMSDDDYYTLVCSLNEKQQQFFLSCLTFNQN